MRTPLVPSLLLLAACGAADADSGSWSGTVDTMADTIVVTTLSGSTSGQQAPSVADSVVVLYQSDDLARPRQLARFADGTMVVAERSALHWISPDGSVRPVGRRGDGPGEFQAITGLLVERGTLHVVDGALRRITWFDNAGQLLDSRSLPPLDGSGPSAGAGMGVVDGRYVIGGENNMVGIGVPTYSSVLVVDLAADTTIISDSTQGVTFQNGPILSPTRLDDSMGIVKVASDGRAAFGAGRDFCVVTSYPDQSPLRICRSWDRVPVTDAVRSPDVQALADSAGMDSAWAARMSEVARNIDAGDWRRSYNELLWDQTGRLWVRVVDERMRDVHPWFSRFAEIRPPMFLWNVFDQDGRLGLEIELPSAFTPLLITADTAYGILELDTGEQVIGAIGL